MCRKLTTLVLVRISAYTNRTAWGWRTWGETPLGTELLLAILNIWLLTLWVDMLKQEGRWRAWTPPCCRGWTNFDNYSGFINADKTNHGNMFFWFFPAEDDPENVPVVIWLQGGTGGSSMFGLMKLICPIITTVDANNQLTGVTKNPCLCLWESYDGWSC